jgi:hypothetical protein
MKRILAFLLALACLAAAPVSLAAAPAGAADFAHWAVVIVAGDDHAYNGNPSRVFDNARTDLARAFAGIGFAPANMAQFSVDPSPTTRTSDIAAIADTLWDLSERAAAGCLIYFTSHGSPDGILVNQEILTPHELGGIVTNACGARPSVIVMSACYSGQFVPDLSAPNRVVITAARADRTSFGCGEFDKYTFFDDCFLRALPLVQGFAALGDKVRECVAFREKQLDASPPSDPQVSVGAKVAAAFDWAGRSAVLRPVP